MSISRMQIEGINVLIQKRKNTKRISIKVMPPDALVKVVSPKRVSDGMIRETIKSCIEKIKEAICKMKSTCLMEENMSDEEDICFLWGKKFKLILKESDKDRVAIVDSRIVMEIKSYRFPFSNEQKDKRLNLLYRQQLQSILSKLSSKYEGVVGVKPDEYRFKDMRTRWGTCNIEKKRIWLSLQLAKKPIECLEYVLVHELVHLLERNHNKRFYAFMDRFYPEWRKVREELKKY